MLTWIRKRFLAPHPLRLTETLARLERLSWDDSEHHPSASERGRRRAFGHRLVEAQDRMRSVGFLKRSDLFGVRRGESAAAGVRKIEGLTPFLRGPLD
jgi:hypothetical protein